MKGRRSPPLVILMDLLLMLIFVLMLRPAETQYELIMPKVFPSDAQMKVSYHIKGQMHWLNDQPTPSDSYSFRWRCTDTVKQWLLKDAQNCIIYFHDDLAKQLSLILFQACLAEHCPQISIPIHQNGQFDQTRFMQLNPGLENNRFFTDWVK